MNKLQEKMYQKILQFVEEKNGQCFASEYTTGNQLIEFKCSNPEHEKWTTKAKYILQGCWCKKCIHDSYRNKNGLSNAKEIAKSYGGECLSNTYKNSHTKLKFKCKNENHKQFELKYSDLIYDGTWCNQCLLESRIKHENLDLVKEIAIKNGGECLSTEYKKSKDKLLFKCSNPEHPAWSTRIDTIVAGHWCPECGRETTKSKTKLSDGLESAILYAEENGGKCLSTEYINSATKMLWKCGNPEHEEWESSYATLVMGKSWCRCCYDDRQRLDDGLNTAIALAEKKGGKCLSTEFVSIKKKMTWKCSNPNHDTWNTSFQKIRNGNWCPECSRNTSERRTRLLFETYFGKQFPSAKPEWNINPMIRYKKSQTHPILELDGYCKEFNVAFEHDGEHHFETIHNQKPFQLTYQKFKDHQKKKNCQRQGITLINIPIIKGNLRNNFQAFMVHVIKHCQEQGLPMSFTDQQILELEDRFNKI